TGWAPAQSVHIFVNDNIGQTWSYNADVVADMSGAFTNQFSLPSSFIATYSVVATGLSSGTATTTFTDGDASSGSGSMTVSPTTVTAASTSNTLTFVFTSDPGKDFVSGSQLSLQVPAGWTTPTPSTGSVAV